MSDGWSDLESKLKSAWPFETDADCTHHENFNFLRETCVSLIAQLRERDAEIMRLKKTIDNFCPALSTGDKAWDISNLVEHNERVEDQLRIAREAIERHRRDMWGDGGVSNDTDFELYAALEKMGAKP
jgi:hypothetical protein